MRHQRIFSHLGWDGAFYVFAGLSAVAIGLLDFTPFINLENDVLLRILLTGVGILLGAVAAQTARRAAEISELREALGLMEVAILDSKKEFQQHLVQRVLQCQKFLLYSNLNREVIPGLDKGDKEYHPILSERLKKRDISLRRVDIVFTKEQLENLIRQLLKHKEEDVYFRHYDPPPKSIPTLNIMSFDDEHIYIGGFNPTEAPTEGQVIFVRQSQIAQYLHDYWNVLWLRATPLNEGRTINWDELRRIGTRVGMTDSEFEQMAERLKSEAG